MTEQVPTTCMRCAVGCGHIQHGVEEGYGIATVRGDGSHPVNQGMACKRGIRETADPGGDWLTTPLVRENGKLQRAGWDEALDRITAGFRDALAETPHGLAVLGSGQQTNEAAYALGKLARGGVGTRYYDANTTLCMASAVTAYYDAFGSDAPPCSYDDVPDANTHLVWGANPSVAHPVMFRWIEESALEDDSRLLVVDPVETKTASVADVHVQPDPGTDLALARAVLARIVERDAVDEAFVEAATEGFDAVRDALPTAAAAARAAGVTLADVDALATAMDAPTLLYWGMGVNQSVQGTDTAAALIDCCLATGNLRPGSGPFSLTGQANSMGTRVCSSKGSWPGQRSFDDPDHRRVVADAWDVPVERLPDETGPGPVGTTQDVATGPIEAVWTVATNPVAGMPDATLVRDRLEDTFLVAQDAFHTETTEIADVVLPAATWGESDGTAMNMERTVSRVRPATALPSDVRTDLDVITTIGERLVPGLFEATEPEAVFEEFVALTAGTEADCSGISYRRLDEEVAVRWPAPDETTAGGYRYVEDGDWSFPTPSGRASFSTATHGGVPEEPDHDYPLVLTTGREADGYNTGIRSRDVAGSDRLRVRANPTTVVDQLDDAEDVVVESRRAAVEASVDLDPAIPEGMLWMPIHHPDANKLTLPVVDPKSAEPNLKQCAVRLRRPTDAAASVVAEVSCDD